MKATTSRRGWRIGWWFFVFFMLINTVLAIGVRPAKTEIAVDELREKSGEIWVVNDDKQEMTISISIEGEMGRYVQVKPDKLQFRADDDAKSFQFAINLPEEVPPGESTAYIVIEEKTDDKDKNKDTTKDKKNDGSADVISSRVILKHKVTVIGPYPDKYIKVNLNFYEASDSIRLVSEVENLGKKGIDTLKTTFYVNDKQKKEHALDSAAISLNSKEKTILDTRIDRDLFEQGEYAVSAVTTYDDQKLETIKEMRVGKPEIDITYFNNYFIANKINEYSVDLFNKWNKKIEHVYVDVEIKKDELIIDDFRTKSVDIEGLAKKRINDYWNTNGKSQGKYTFDMIVNFWNDYAMEAKRFEAEIISEEKVKELPITGAAISQSTSFSNPLLVLIIGILLGVIIFYVIWRYKNKEKYDDGGRIL